MNFTKMHGLGNDYVYVNCFAETVENPPQLAQNISDRHFGIGSDGLVLVMPSKLPGCDVKMRIFNADGSEAEMCGNGLRCVAKFAYENNLAQTIDSFSVPGQQSFPAALKIETGNGILTTGLVLDENDNVEKVCVNMGQPILEPAQIPVETTDNPTIDFPLEIDGEQLLMTAVSMGNPHAVFFCENVDDIDLTAIGPIIENHPIFPNRVNAHFVQPLAPNEFKMRTWERGSGITMACGTGACACAVAAVLTGKCNRITTAHLPGGPLELNWSLEDNCVYMTGPAVTTFTGTWLL